MPHTTPTITPFSVNPGFDFEIRSMIGRSPAAAGEILAATEHIGKGDHTAWHDAWAGLGERAAAVAAEAADHGHRVSAADAYLRASQYFGYAVNALSALGDSDGLGPAFAKQQQAWLGFVATTTADVTPVQIPYEGDSLPGYLVRPEQRLATGASVVGVNGSDGSLAAMWASLVAPALERGYAVLVFDGPGQQSQLFEKNVPFRPDWENVLTPVFDFVSGLDGIDAGKVGLYGISQAGYWVTRGIAFEHRFAAAITDPGVVDVSTSWTEHLPKSLLGLLEKGQLEKFDKEMAFGLKFSPEIARTWNFRARPYGTTGYGETIQAVREYNASDVAAQITTPLLILSPENEQFWPGQSEQLAALTPTVSTVVHFTAAEGADEHCEPLGRAVAAQRMFDWLDERIA